MQSSEKDLSEFGILEPQERLKELIRYSNAVEIDPHVPPRRYYNSGLDMVRMANVYLEEGSLENAYVLYLKFMTLFLEKIRKHPDFSSVPVDVKAVNQAKLREVLPKAEKLKARLLDEYTKQYNRYIAELKRQQKKEEELKKKEAEREEELKKLREASQIAGWSSKPADVKIKAPSTNLDTINYPDPNLPSATPSNTSYTSEDSQNQSSTNDFKIPSAPSIDRTNKPSGIFSSTTFTRSGLRTVVVPVKVMANFLTLAAKNTLSNIETCGILAGKLERNELIITHMILPKQKGTPDSCTTMNEEEIFDYQDRYNLITIGWIHTHPTQTAFLSSVDLHTHCPYQLLMPEAIAIVCAPKYNETGFFILTPSYGLEFISNCRKSGFHPHPTEPPLFMKAEHIKIDNGSTLEVLDLRS